MAARMPRYGALVVVLLLLVPAGPAASQDAPACLGRAPTIVGTGGSDVLVGTPGPDVIAGLGGHDVIRGLGGHDRLCGGPGADTLVGGPGSDRLAGAGGYDSLRGGKGNDRLAGGPGADACLQGSGSGPASSCSRAAASACSLPGAYRRRIRNGVHPTRSGEVQIVPVGSSFMGPGISHAGPWDYLQRVPLFLYGPGFVEARGEVPGAPTLASLAPTQAELLGEPFPGAEAPLLDALVPEDQRPDPPRLIVTLVWDAGGINVLERWPGAWPNLRALIPGGAWYRRAEVGSSPSNTPPAHATIGTGAFASEHGLVDLGVREDGSIVGSWSRGPRLLLADTLADVYDAGHGNEPLVGVIGGVTEHLGMAGHGSVRPGGDADLGVLPVKGGPDLWGLKPAVAPYFAFPGYVNEVKGLGHEARLLDERDGRRDGRWRTNRLRDLRGGFDSPARIPYQTRITREVLRTEGFGQDAVPDLLFLNHKIIDFVGHEWTMDAKEMKDTLRIQDEDLARFVELLDAEVGQGRWVLMLTADHAMTPDPRRSGMIPLDRTKVAARVEARFGERAVERVRPTMVFLDDRGLRRRGHRLEEVATFVLGLTRRQVALDEVPPARRMGRAFRAAFPSSWMGRLACMR